jgi:hypothetical protein
MATRIANSNKPLKRRVEKSPYSLRVSPHARGQRVSTLNNGQSQFELGGLAPRHGFEPRT